MSEQQDQASEQTMEETLGGVAEAAVDFARAAVQPVSFGPLSSGNREPGRQNLDLLLDVNIPVSVEVGRTQMSLDEILDLVPGSVVTLDKKAEEPVDLRVNGKLVARGEVVLVDDVYGVRITQILDPSGRIESLKHPDS
jgi:flagellar motor switch protein FliN/FliY